MILPIATYCLAAVGHSCILLIHTPPTPRHVKCHLLKLNFLLSFQTHMCEWMTLPATVVSLAVLLTQNLSYENIRLHSPRSCIARGITFSRLKGVPYCSLSQQTCQRESVPHTKQSDLSWASVFTYTKLYHQHSWQRAPGYESCKVSTFLRKMTWQ